MEVGRSRYVMDSRRGAPALTDTTGGDVPQEVEELVAALARARRAERNALERQRLIVQQLRVQGASWAVIGAALGVTREAAFKRYSGDRLV